MKHQIALCLCALTLAASAAAAAEPAAAGNAAASPGGDNDTAKEAKASGGSKAAGAPAEAKVAPLDDRIKAVQGRKFIKALRAEIFPWMGVSLNDAFYRYYHVGLSGTFHIMEGLALEIGGSGAPIRQVLEPVIFLRESKSAIPATSRYFGNVFGAVQLSPIYGKMLLFGQWILHYDTFFLGGLGLAADSSFLYIHPEATLGIGQRVFLFDWLVLRADLRGSAYPQYGSALNRPISNVQSQITALFGVGFYIPPFFPSDVPKRSGKK